MGEVSNPSKKVEELNMSIKSDFFKTEINNIQDLDLQAFVREYLEPKLMGKGLGTHPLGMLAAVYVGLVLFGVAGVITGPLAFILIRELVTFINRKQGNSTRSSNG